MGLYTNLNNYNTFVQSKERSLNCHQIIRTTAEQLHVGLVVRGDEVMQLRVRL